MSTVSVIIPVYNGAEFIGETLDSVLAQTLTDLEIVVVDDGSTDATADIVRACADRRVRLISTANGGTASATNIGIDNSTGAYLQIIGADDLILPDKLARQVQLLDAHPAVDVVYSSFRYFCDSCCDVHAPPWLRPPSEDPYRELVRGSMFPPQAALVRRVSVEAVGGFNAELLSGEDWDLWLRIARAGSRFLFHDDLLALYRQHATQKTRRRARWRRAHVQIMENLRREAKDDSELARIDWHYWASNNYTQWALSALLEGDASVADAAFATAYVYDRGLGHEQEDLARLIVQYALEYDARDSSCDITACADFLSQVRDALPPALPAAGVLRRASALYWWARVYRAHALTAGKEVRQCFRRAMRGGGWKQVDVGELSILIQSFIGQENWARVRRVWR